MIIMEAPSLVPLRTSALRPPRRKRVLGWLVGLAASGLLAATAEAQGTIVTDSRTHSLDSGTFGTSRFGGSLGGSVNATRTYVSGVSPLRPNHRLAAELESYVTIFNNTLEAANFQAAARNEPYTLSPAGGTPIPGYQPSTTVFLRLAGNTVWNASYSSTSFSQTWAVSFGPYNTPSYSLGFSLLGITANVTGSAGVSARASLTASADVASVSLGAGGYAYATARGSASASVSAGAFASARVSSSLDFGTPRVEANLNAELFTGFSGNGRICSGWINLVVQLQVQVSLLWGKIRRGAILDLINLSLPETCVDFSV